MRSRARFVFLPAALTVAACAAPDRAPDRGDTFLTASVRQARVQTASPVTPDSPDPEPFAGLDARRADAASRFARATELVGLLEPPTADLEALAADDAALAAWLGAPPDGALELEAGLGLVWLRDPSIRAGREGLLASLEGYDQARFLEDVVSRYRSFTRTSSVRVGPPSAAGSKRQQSELAPYPAIDALRGELVERDVEAAWHALRGTVARRLAAAQRALARLAFVDEAARVTGGHLALLADLDSALLARVGGGQARQADLLTLRTERERLEAELTVLAEERRGWTAALLALLDLGVGASPDATWAIGAIAPSAAVRVADALVEADLAAAPDVAGARTRVERLRVALRLAETMALSPLDLGASRFERGAAGEGGVARRVDPSEIGPVPSARRSGFGPTEALLREMRARVSERESRLAEVSAEVAASAERAGADWRAAAERVRVHEEALLPLARASYDGLRGSYSSGAASFLDVYRAARRLLDLELGIAAARRDGSIASADWMERTGRR